VLIALLAMLTGCDKKVAWRGVGTDSKEADRSSDQQTSQQSIRVWNEISATSWAFVPPSSA
jgi:hypothetical protein